MQRQRCQEHFLRNALAYANRGQKQMVFALTNTIVAQEAADAAHGPTLPLQPWEAPPDKPTPLVRARRPTVL